MESYYSKAVPDRSGSFILNSLMAHAYLFKLKRKYIGVVGNNQDIINIRKLIQTIGLENILLLHKNVPPNSKIININEYFSDSHFTNEWLSEIAHIPRSISEKKYPKTRHRVVVHIRRGDVNKKMNNKQRYIPNSYFLEKIGEYRQANSEILIFSETTPFESFKEFTDIGCILKLDGDLSEVWLTSINSDVFIMSKSAFSQVPALFANGLVIYYKYWHQPQSNWIVSNY